MEILLDRILVDFGNDADDILYLVLLSCFLCICILRLLVMGNSSIPIVQILDAVLIGYQKNELSNL